MPVSNDNSIFLKLAQQAEAEPPSPLLEQRIAEATGRLRGPWLHSLDAAVDLAPPGWVLVRMTTASDDSHWVVELAPREDLRLSVVGIAATEIQARAGAALRGWAATAGR